MDEPAVANPFAVPVDASNPFFDVGPAPGATSNPFLMDDVAVSEPVASSAFNPFATVVTEETGANAGLEWLTSGGAMPDQGTSPYDLPHGPMSHDLDDLLDVDVPLPDELVGHAENATPSPQPSPIPEMKFSRPVPPPRPPSRPSPAHETQQLILSVTGAMAATSEHLLDRLRATAPSPVPGHLPPTPHSPSPSPSPCPSPPAEMDLLADEMPAPTLLSTSRPSSPAVPARPALPPARAGPPSRPPAPAVQPSPTRSAPPPRPTAGPGVAQAEPVGFAGIFGGPPAPSELEVLAFAAPDEQRATREEPAEEIDLLGLPKPRTRTKNDILKLYEKKDEKDLLAGDVFGSLVDLDGQPAAPMLPEAPASSTPAAPAAPAASIFDQEDFTGQQPIELAFTGPSAAPAAVPAAPTAGRVEEQPVLAFPEIKSPEKSGPIAIPGAGAEAFGAAAPAQEDDAFDAFSSRFDKVGREDFLVVDNDPFDPFSAGGSTKGNSGDFIFNSLNE